MKTILLILALALVARAQLSGYQALDIAEAQSSTEIQTLIQFGLQTIVQDAIQLGYFNNTDFALSKINSVYEKVSDSGDYLFDVVYADPSGVSISANFEVNYNVALNSISIVSYSYGVSYPAVDPTDDSDDTPVVENWSKIAVSTFNSNQELQALFQSGLARVIANGVNNASIPDTTFISAVISNIAQRSVDNGVVYRFSAKVSDQKGTTLTLTFDVLNQLYSSVYGVTVTPLPPVDNSTNSTNPEEGEGETEVGETGETGETGPEDGEDDGEVETPTENGEVETPTENGEVETPTENGEVETPTESGEVETPTEEEATVPVDPVDPVEPGNNSTNTTEPADDVDIVAGLPYTRLDVDEALESNLVNVLLKYGYQGVTQLGIRQNKLQNTTYSVLNVSKVGRYNFTNGVSYLFEVNLIGDNRRILVDTNYTVYYRYSNKTAKLTTYYYNYTNFRNEIPNTDNNTTIPDTNTTIPDTNTTIPDTNTTIPDTNTTIPDTNTTIPDTNTTIPDTNTTIPDNNTTAPVDLITQIQQDALLQSVFSYGVNGVLTSGIAKGKLVDTDYNVTNVFDYKRTNLSSTANFRFDTRLANSNGSVVVFANFTVNYRYSNQSLKLLSFSYNTTIIKNVPNTPSGNNNTNTTVPSTNTTNNGTNSTDNTYVAVNASEIASSQEIQSVLSYGTQQIIQRGIQSGKIPSANYTISEVVSVSKLAQKAGNSYQCSVNLDGDNEAEVKSTFTAFYNSTSQAVSLQKYSYAVSNIPVA